jgi:SAM-dependent methyltransferase
VAESEPLTTANQSETYGRFLARYEEEQVPWDDPAPPPEIEALPAILPPGRALDLGCGYGRTAIYLARFGWQVVGVDFIPKAIDVARERALAAGVADRAAFHVASAAKLDFLLPPFDLVVDIGCVHSFDESMFQAYRDELARLLRPGGLYMLFAHLRGDDAVEGEGPRGIPEGLIHDTLGNSFRLEKVEYGTTQVEDRPPWNSAWFWFRRR